MMRTHALMDSVSANLGEFLHAIDAVLTRPQKKFLRDGLFKPGGTDTVFLPAVKPTAMRGKRKRRTSGEIWYLSLSPVPCPPVCVRAKLAEFDEWGTVAGS